MKPGLMNSLVVQLMLWGLDLFIHKKKFRRGLARGEEGAKGRGRFVDRSRVPDCECGVLAGIIQLLAVR